MKPNRLNCVSIALLALAAALPLAKAEEKSSVYKSLLAKYDANKDGRLSVAEREVIRTDRLRPSPRRERRQFRYPDPVSYTHLTLPTILACRSRWSPYH